MKQLVLYAFCAAVVVWGLAPMSAAASPCNVYAFGDSLSDTGAASAYSAFTQSDGLEPPSTPPETPPVPLVDPIVPPIGFYFEGRLSDGPVWVESFAAAMCAGGTLTSFARAGAFSDDRNANEDIGVSGGLRTQVFEDLNDVIGDDGSFAEDDIVTVWAFSNNVVFDLLMVDPQWAVRDVSEAVQYLASRGAKRILVLNAPAIGDTPFGRFLSEQAFPGLFRNLNARVTQYNNMLRIALSGLEAALDARVVQLDINALFRAVLINPGAFGFVNVAIPCMIQDDNRIRVLTGACPVDTSSAPLKLITVGTVFYDLLHPTEAVHQQISAAAQGVVGAAASASATSAP